MNGRRKRSVLECIKNRCMKISIFCYVILILFNERNEKLSLKLDCVRVYIIANFILVELNFERYISMFFRLDS